MKLVWFLFFQEMFALKSYQNNILYLFFKMTMVASYKFTNYAVASIQNHKLFHPNTVKIVYFLPDV